MPHMHTFGAVNIDQGICGFTSVIYAVYANCPHLHGSLDNASGHERTRLMAEIKTFLVLLRAMGKQPMLDEIQALTRSFSGYGTWTIDSFIKQINDSAQPITTPAPNVDFSIAMPPKPLMEYMRVCWDLNPVQETALHEGGGNVILGLTCEDAPVNAFGNLAHYVYKTPDGWIQSWGQEFEKIADLNGNFSIVSRIRVA